MLAGRLWRGEVGSSEYHPIGHLGGLAGPAAAAGRDGDGGDHGDAAAEEALRLAGHLAELARLAAPGDHAIGEIHRRVFSARADAATSTMARGVFRWAAADPEA